jgi:hypothetical protein
MSNTPETKRLFGLLGRYAGIEGLSTRTGLGRGRVDRADEITVELVPEATDDVRALIGELDRVLSAEYTPEQRHGLALDAIFKPGIRFYLARSNDVAVGCGGWRSSKTSPK